MTASTIQIAGREPADFRFTARQSDWQGGHNRLYFQLLNAPTEPRFWDAYNVDSSVEGEFKLARLFERVQTDASNKKPFLRSFNSKIYRLEGIANPAVQSTSDGSVWNSVSMVSGPTTVIRGAAVWRNNLIVVANANAIYRLDSTDTWTSLNMPTGITQVCDMIGISPDDKLLAWFNAKGLYQTAVLPPAAGDWTKVWPASTDPDEATCDVIDGSNGTVTLVTSDATGSSIHEYFTAEGAATAASLITWMKVQDTFFFNRGRLYDSAAYFGSKKGLGGGSGTNGNGQLWRKERSSKPMLVQEFGDGIRGSVPTRDFGIRALVSDGTHLWIGASSRAADFNSVVGVPCVYWYNVDDDGVESVSPNSSIEDSPGNIADTVYDAEIINGEVLITTSTGTWKRSKTKFVSRGYLDSSIHDLRAPDHEKTWNFQEIQVEDATANESVSQYYRTGTLVGSWLGGDTVTASGAKKILFPDDNKTLGQYRLNSRQIQLHTVLARGADNTKSPRVTSIAVNSAQIRAVGS